MKIDPIFPLAWIIVIGVVLTLLTLGAHLRSGRQLGRRRNFLLSLIRLLGVLAVVSLLLQISEEESIVPPSVERSFLVGVDKSASMGEDDIDGVTRYEYACQILKEAGLLQEERNPHVHFHVFDSKVEQISPKALTSISPDGDETLMHTSVRQLFRAYQGAPPAALLLLSDGHDLEAISPGQTAKIAHDRECVIYGMPIGEAGSVRDASIRITRFHPYTFREQLTRMTATIRTVGCPRETLVVDLIREGKTIESQRIQTGEKSFHDVEFIVSEEDPGQYEYTFKVRPIKREATTKNNSAVSYLNVLDEKIRVLLVEGSPYWDTTFLRRSLARNDKLDVDALTRFTKDRVRAVRSNPKRSKEGLLAPQKVEDFKPYKIVILGKNVDDVLGENGIQALEEWVDQHAGIVIFSRGRSWEGLPDSGLEPIKWAHESAPARLEVSSAARSVPPFKLLERRLASNNLPEVISYQASGKPKTLAESYVKTEGQNSGVVFRRFGRGQTLSFGVGDLWKWVFNSKTEFDNNLYDLFWDQLVLWMLSNGGVTPGSGYTFQTNTANLALGEKVTFTFSLNGKEPPQSQPKMIIDHQDEEVAVLALTPNDDASAYSATFTPRVEGRYTAQITLPDGKKVQARFITYVEEVERTETVADAAYLKQLATASGGRLVEPAELKSLYGDFLREASPMKERFKLVPLWDQVWVLLMITFFLALEWFLRRRWGLT